MRIRYTKIFIFVPVIFVLIIFSIVVYFDGIRDNDQLYKFIEPKPPLKLDSVIIFFRHRKRTPSLKKFILEDTTWDHSLVETDIPETVVRYKLYYPNDEECIHESTAERFYNSLPVLRGGAKQGQLTLKGQEDSYKLGQLLNQKYLINEQLLSDHQELSKIRLYSTNYARTIKSMRSFLAGMLKSDADTVYRIYTRTTETEIYYPNYYFCSKYNKIYAERSKQIDTDPIQLSIRNQLIDRLKRDNSDLPSIPHIWEEMSTLKGHLGQLPVPFEENLHLIESAAISSFIFRNIHDSTSIRYACGLLLKEILNHLSNKSDKIKLIINSVHDSTLLCLLSTLRYKVVEWPAFSSYIVFEKYIDTLGNLFIATIFDGKNVLEKHFPSPIQIEKFIKFVSEYIPKETTFDELCK